MNIHFVKMSQSYVLKWVKVSFFSTRADIQRVFNTSTPLIMEKRKSGPNQPQSQNFLKLGLLMALENVNTNKPTRFMFYKYIDIFFYNSCNEQHIQPILTSPSSTGSLSDRFIKNLQENDANNDGFVTGIEFYNDFLNNYDIDKDGCCSG